MWNSFCVRSLVLHCMCYGVVGARTPLPSGHHISSASESWTFLCGKTNSQKPTFFVTKRIKEMKESLESSCNRPKQSGMIWNSFIKKSGLLWDKYPHHIYTHIHTHTMRKQMALKHHVCTNNACVMAYRGWANGGWIAIYMKRLMGHWTVVFFSLSLLGIAYVFKAYHFQQIKIDSLNRHINTSEAAALRWCAITMVRASLNAARIYFRPKEILWFVFFFRSFIFPISFLSRFANK